jgi:hypothetical protein
MDVVCYQFHWRSSELSHVLQTQPNRTYKCIPRFLTLRVRLVRSCLKVAKVAFYHGSKSKYLATPKSDGDAREEAQEVHEKRAGATDRDSNARGASEPGTELGTRLKEIPQGGGLGAWDLVS